MASVAKGKVEKLVDMINKFKEEVRIFGEKESLKIQFNIEFHQVDGEKEEENQQEDCWDDEDVRVEGKKEEEDIFDDDKEKQDLITYIIEKRLENLKTQHSISKLVKGLEDYIYVQGDACNTMIHAIKEIKELITTPTPLD